MKPKKHAHYPDMQAMRRRSNLVCMAIQKLAWHGIDIISVDLTKDDTVIEVANCPSVMALRGESTGQGCTQQHRKYVQKRTQVCGCLVIWSELI